LNDAQLEKLPLPETLKINIVDARDMKKIAMKRQVQFVGKLLRNVDNLDEVHKLYDVLVHKDKSSNLLFTRLEKLRDNLLDLNKSPDILDNLISDFPDMDIQKLRQLIRNHNREIEKNKPKKSFKEIFQFVKHLHGID
jgi:ribosome-associated protein